MKWSAVPAGILALGLLWTPAGAQEVPSQKTEEVRKIDDTIVDTEKNINTALTSILTTPETKALVKKKIAELINDLKRDNLQVSGINIHIVPSWDKLISVATGSDDARTWKSALVEIQ